MTAKMRRSGVSSVPIPEDCGEMLDASFSSIASSTMTTQEGANCCYNYDNYRNRSSFSVSSSCISTSARSSVSNDKPAFGNCVPAKKPHKAHDRAWEAIRAVRCDEGSLGLKNFRLVKKIGSGDIGKVYLCELRGFSECVFAMKVVDKEALVHRNKLHRAEMERKILCSLDHPFLPTLYAHFEASQYSCLVMEYCARGDLHSLRLRQDGRRFGISPAKFYAGEVLVALEYLHMMGVVYRDLKPENVLVREDGHVMLSDFDLSFTCNVTPTLHRRRPSTPCRTPESRSPRRCFFPLRMRGRRSKKKKARHKSSPSSSSEAQSPGRLRQRVVVAEPVEARSRSFVGTHEYLAPEVILGRGHGAAVDWWALGIFLYEMLFGETPFKGPTKDATLTNIISSPLRFPKVVTRCQVTKMKWEAAQDLIQRLLCKDPSRRLGSRRGSSEIKSHPFFQGLNWALIRSTAPPRSPSGRPRDSTIKQRTQPSAAGCHMPPRPSNLTPRFKYF